MRLKNYYASRDLMEFRGKLAHFIVNHPGGGGFTLPRAVTSVPGEHETPRRGLATTPKTRTESRRQLDGKLLACSELVFKTISHELSDLPLVGNNGVKYIPDPHICHRSVLSAQSPSKGPATSRLFRRRCFRRHQEAYCVF